MGINVSTVTKDLVNAGKKIKKTRTIERNLHLANYGIQAKSATNETRTAIGFIPQTITPTQVASESRTAIGFIPQTITPTQAPDGYRSVIKGFSSDAPEYKQLPQGNGLKRLRFLMPRHLKSVQRQIVPSLKPRVKINGFSTNQDRVEAPLEKGRLVLSTIRKIVKGFSTDVKPEYTAVNPMKPTSKINGFY